VCFDAVAPSELVLQQYPGEGVVLGLSKYCDDR
jgi:hypothetical protein